MEKRRRTALFKISILFLLFAAAVALITAVSYRSMLKAFYPLRQTELVERYAAENGLDEALVYAVIKTESDFKPGAVSAANAKGLMQLTLPTFQWLQTKTGEQLSSDALFDEETNVRYGTLFLRLLQEEFGSTQEVLAAYHAGRGQVNRWLEDPGVSSDGKTLDHIPIPETAHYVKKVTKAIHRYHNLYHI
ncbi:MAG TPA: lytic transglycosylase domain-containing protein [Candidatus Fimivicinus intestinavium]|nr:lytic transglycosylase domain-containing protein [Candidatus Fimivicinus intestinavium]